MNVQGRGLPPIEQSIGKEKATLLRANLKSMAGPKVKQIDAVRLTRQDAMHPEVDEGRSGLGDSNMSFEILDWRHQSDQGAL